MNPKIHKPYYQVSKNTLNQIKSGSTRRKENAILFLIRKLKNFVLAQLAYNCPFNSWRIKFHKWRGVNIGKNVMIGFNVILDYSYPELIYIEDDVSLAGNNYILTHSNPYEHFSKVLPSYISKIEIKKGAWIGIGAMILPGVIIEEYSIVSAMSLVTKDVPSKTLVGGVPAKVLKDLNNDLENL
jgi:acetyltransferase-like isoleucine patch superfamily enzyme